MNISKHKISFGDKYGVINLNTKDIKLSPPGSTKDAIDGVVVLGNIAQERQQSPFRFIHLKDSATIQDAKKDFKKTLDIEI